jgi:hypothetical protein
MTDFQFPTVPDAAPVSHADAPPTSIAISIR